MENTARENVSIKSLREELVKLDDQIANAKNLQEILEEEKKPLYTVYEWQAPERIYEIKDRKWYVLVSVVSMFVIVYSLLTNNFLLVAAVIATLVLVYALYTVPPRLMSHKITNKGIYLFDRLFTWNFVNYFWITKRGTHFLINIEAKDKQDSYPEKIIVLKGDGELEKIVGYLSQFVDYLPEAEITNNFITRRVDGEYLPLTDFLSEGELLELPKDTETTI